MSQLTSSLFALLDFDPPHQPIPFPDNPHGSVCDLEQVSGDSGFSPYGLAEGFHRVEDSYSNDEALLVLLEELQPGSASGRLEDPDPGMFVESIGFDSDPSHMEILDVLLEDLSPYEGEEEPRWEELHRAARGGGGGVSGMEIDVLVDPALDFEEPVGVADLSELHLVEEEVLDLDYGAFLEQLLSDEDVGGRRGSAPASKKVVENLPLVELGKEDLERGAAVCAVCKDEVDEGQLVNRLPCYHYFHRDCILPWLRMRSTCPVCRFVLPSNDQRV